MNIYPRKIVNNSLLWLERVTYDESILARGLATDKNMNNDYPSHKDSQTKVNKSKVLYNAEIVACLSRIDLNLSKLASKNHKVSDLLSKGL